jgi:gamma-glutamyl-gamma-aminobutyrate hydrolase PuuD
MSLARKLAFIANLAVVSGFPIPAAQAAPCALKPAESLTLACTVDCGSAIHERMQRAALHLGYRVNWVTLNPARPDLNGVDALITPGGMDIDPKFYLDAVDEGHRSALLEDDAKYGHHSELSRTRDAFEVALFRNYFTSDNNRSLPVLGICYGLQMLAVANHLPLVVDLPHDLGIPARYHLNDRVELVPGSRIEAIVGKRSLLGAEMHHQAVDIRRLQELHPANVAVTGTSNDAHIPEVMEYAERPALAVQFHPEISDPELSDRIFGWLLQKACEKRRVP